jgi:hypothetical protein
MGKELTKQYLVHVSIGDIKAELGSLNCFCTPEWLSTTTFVEADLFKASTGDCDVSGADVLDFKP